MIRTIHRAKYVLVDPDLLLTNAAVHVSQPGRISRVEPWLGVPKQLEAEVFDWGSSIIIPGLVNAHTHLELTNLENQLTACSSFTDWLGKLIERRSSWTAQDYADSVRRGADISLSSGTTCVADITASGSSRSSLEGIPLRKVVLEEIIGMSPQKVPEAVASLERRLDMGLLDPLTEIGISPHAPYSVCPELYRAAASMAADRGLMIASHVAETSSEEAFLYSGTGEFRSFLSRMGALPDSFVPPGLKPVPYLDRLGVLERPSLLIHCNYLDEESKTLLLQRRSSVVYCPRSHAFFGHDPHPVRELLDLGVNVALGTDSLASNSSLSMLDEMRHLHMNRHDIKPEEIFRMATLNGASALQLSGSLGRLRRGNWADLTILRLPEEVGERRLLTEILEGAGECCATLVQGEMAWQAV